MFSVLSSTIYSIMTKPSTKSIVKPILKGSFLGIGAAYIYYRYRKISYD
jgi:hypothetical protein